MTAPKFTPGKWSVDEVSPRYVFVIGPEGWWVAEVCGDESKIADAHLIAAAPELYEALSQCREWVQLAADHPAAEPEVYDALSALDAAIAKARGEG